MCLATNKRLEPGLPFPEFCEKYGAEGQAYVNDVDRARQAIIEETERNANRTLPTFVPGCQVSQQRVYGHQVYTKAGLLTDAEVISIVGKSAVALGMPEFKADARTTQSKQTFYLVSLNDVPNDLKNGIRKIKIFHTVSAVRDSLQCTPETQISPLQLESVFSHAAKVYGDSRPSESGLKTIPELQELATLIDNQLEQQMVEDSLAATGEDAVAAMVQSKVVATQARALEGLVEDAPPPPKRPKRAKAAATNPATRAEAPQYPAIADVTGAADPVVSGTGSGSSKRQVVLDQDIAGMDAEMAKVASVHCQSNRSASAKCLIQLVPSNYFSAHTDQSKGKAIFNASRPSNGSGQDLEGHLSRNHCTAM